MEVEVVCKSKKYLKLKLTETIADDNVEYVTANLTADGGLVWETKRTYDQLITPDTVSAILFANENGQLLKLKEFKVNPIYSFTLSGAISPDGSIAYITICSLDNLLLGAVRVINLKDFTEKLITLLNFDNSNGFVVPSSIAFLDNRYTTICYPNAQDNNYSLAVLDLISGTIVTTIKLLAIARDGGILFRLRNKIYVSVRSYYFSDASYYQIFKLRKGELIEVLKLSFSTLCDQHSVRIKDDIAVIAINAGGGSEGSLGIWIMNFDGKKLCMSGLSAALQAFNAVLSPNIDFVISQCLSISNIALRQSVTFRLDKKPACNLYLITSVSSCCKDQQVQLQLIDNNYILQFSPLFAFSDDGKWLIASGGRYNKDEQVPLLPTIALFKVKYTSCE